MRTFVLVMEELPQTTRPEIDSGAMRREAVNLANSIRSSIFTSRGIRRDVNVVLYPVDSKSRMIVIDGKKLRFMGPDERSISILLSMATEKVMSERVEKEVTSPGVTIISRTKPLGRIGNDSLILNQSSDGSDLRSIKLTENNSYICALSDEWRFGDIGAFMEEKAQTPIALKSAGQTDRTVLMINNEIDRQKLCKHTI